MEIIPEAVLSATNSSVNAEGSSIFGTSKCWRYRCQSLRTPLQSHHWVTALNCDRVR